MLHFPGLLIAGNVFMFYINSLKKINLGNINHATIHELPFWDRKSTNPLFLEQVVVGFVLLHLSKSSLYFQNFQMAWILWALGACFVGNIALEVFPAFLLRQPIGNTLKALSYILQFGQIHFAIWTNTFCYLDKCI